MSTTPFSRAVVWGLFAVAVLANAAGWILNLYNKIWWYDEALHLGTTFAFTLVLALFAYGAVLSGARTHSLLLILAIACIGVALGALWELAEWAYDQIVRPNVIKGRTDTMVDLIMDTVGALAAGYVASRMLSNSHPDKPG